MPTDHPLRMDIDEIMPTTMSCFSELPTPPPEAPPVAVGPSPLHAGGGMGPLPRSGQQRSSAAVAAAAAAAAAATVAATESARRGTGLDDDDHDEHGPAPATTRPTDGAGGGWEERKPSIDDFQLINTLGTGTFARVWLVRRRSGKKPNEFFALKQLKKADVIRLKQCEHVNNERSILETCRDHPFIVNLRSYWQDRSSLYILLDYMPGGEIFGYLRRRRRFDFVTTRFYAAEITTILVFLHSHGIVYRDLKPENILLDCRGHVKLVDFGFSKKIGDRETYTLCGTPEYLSPEVIQSKGHGKAVDWWALGVLISEMTCGFPPFYDSSPIGIYEKIVAGRLALPSWMPSETKDIVQRLCTKDLSARLGNMRGGGEQVMRHPFFNGIDWAELESQVKPGPIVPEIRFAGDTRYFDSYDPPPPETGKEYPDEMFQKYDDMFKDF